MAELLAAAPVLLLSVVVGYLLGALPLADRLSRRHGVDIFSTGTGLAGSTNVRHAVGNVPALIVFIGDMGKGALAVVVSDLLGVEGPWVVLPAGAAILGHWKSVFTGFRGGDGMATLGGAILAAFPILGLVSVAVAGVVAYGGQRMPYTSLLSIVFGYAALVGLNIANQGDTVLALGFGGLAGLVLAYAISGHRRRRHASGWDEVEEAGGATEGSEARR